MADSKFPTTHQSNVAFNSDAYDRITTLLSQVQGLASCLTVLGCRGVEDLPYQLIDDALPMLGAVISGLASDAEAAADAMWEQSEGRRAALVQCSEVAA